MHLSTATSLRLWRAARRYGTTAQRAAVERGGGGQPAGQERATPSGGTPVTAALASLGVLRRHGGLRRLTGGLPATLAVVLAAGVAIYPVEDRIRLGLDLRGGVHLVLRVQTDDALRVETETNASQLSEQVGLSGISLKTNQRLEHSHPRLVARRND